MRSDRLRRLDRRATLRDVPKPPFSIGQNAAEYGRTRTPRSARAKLLRLIAVLVAVVVVVLVYRLTR